MSFIAGGTVCQMSFRPDVHIWSRCSSFVWTEGYIRTIGSARKDALKPGESHHGVYTKSCSSWHTVWSHGGVDVIRAYLSISILPRTHVWCSGRISALLFGIPSLGSLAVSSKSSSLSKLLFRVFLVDPLSLALSPGFPLLSPSSIHRNFSRVNKTIWHFRLCWGPVGPKLAGKRLYAYSDTQWCTRRQRVPLELWSGGGNEKGRKKLWPLPVSNTWKTHSNMQVIDQVVMFKSGSWRLMSA